MPIRTQLKVLPPLSFNVTADVFGDKGYIVEMYGDDFEICLSPKEAQEVGIELITKAREARLKQQALDGAAAKKLAEMTAAGGDVSKT